MPGLFTARYADKSATELPPALRAACQHANPQSWSAMAAFAAARFERESGIALEAFYFMTDPQAKFALSEQISAQVKDLSYRRDYFPACVAMWHGASFLAECARPFKAPEGDTAIYALQAGDHLRDIEISLQMGVVDNPFLRRILPHLDFVASAAWLKVAAPNLRATQLLDFASRVEPPRPQARQHFLAALEFAFAEQAMPASSGHTPRFN